MLNRNILENDERTVLALRELYSAYGYTPFRMSKFEEYDLYRENKNFLVSDRVITFNDTDGRLLALKPDVTLSIIKNTPDSGVNKLYYNENVYRVSGMTGQFKEIMQAGLECIGNLALHDLVEVVMLAAKSLSLISRDYVLDISHMGIVSALLDDLHLSDGERRDLMRMISEKNSHGILSLLGSIGIPLERAEKLTSLVSVYGKRSEVLASLKGLSERVEYTSALRVLEALDKLLTRVDPEDRVRFDFSVVNDMNYYNGLVFKGFINGISDGVLAGGEYGRLLSDMGYSGDAIGFAIYLDLLVGLGDSGDGYDVDMLLVYSESDPIEKVIALKEKFISEGLSTLAVLEPSDKIRYHSKCIFSEKEV